ERSGFLPDQWTHDFHGSSPSQRALDGQAVTQRPHIVCSDPIDALPGGVELGRERRRTALVDGTPSEQADDRLARDPDQQRQTEAAAELAEASQDGDRRLCTGTEKESHARIEDAALARDAGGLEGREPAFEESHHALVDGL